MIEQNTVYELDAKKAREITESAEALNGTFARQQTKEVLGCIQRAATNAERSVRISGDMLDTRARVVIVNRLKGLGFKVEHFTGDQRDPCDVFTILW